ncbi:MAG: hypothetical protein RSB66_06790 [Clostridium sp.]
MNVYTITYYLVEETHSCGCSEEHDHDHGCCDGHHHDDDHECCGGHGHEDGHECCGGHGHEDGHECCGGHDHEDGHECGCHGEDDHEEEHYHGRDDYEITAHIKTLGAWAHFMPTSFLVKTEKSADEIMDILRPTVEDGDMIFVNKIDKDNVAALNPAITDWIRR